MVLEGVGFEVAGLTAGPATRQDRDLPVAHVSPSRVDQY